MRIAICFSGQPRTWEKCYDQQKKFIKAIEDKISTKIDIFCHAWDFNTLPHGILAEEYTTSSPMPSGVTIDHSDLQAMLEKINPVSFLIENETKSISTIVDTISRNRRHDKIVGECAVSWASPQFYGIMRSAHLKKVYEYENNFRYSMCIRMRYDLYIDDIQIEHFINECLAMPEHNAVYTCHTSRDSCEFPYVRIGDIFWFADSVSYNRICDFYKWFPVIGTKPFKQPLISTEHGLMYYTKMIKMNIRPISIDPKIYRSEDYLDKKLLAGQPPTLGNHELL